MKIKKKLYLSFGFVVVLLLLIFMTIIFALDKISSDNEKRDLAREITLSNAELNLLLNQYLFYPEEGTKKQWLVKYDSTLEIILRGDPEKSEDLEIVLEDYSDLKKNFLRLVENRKEKDVLEREGTSVSEIMVATNLEKELVAEIQKESQSILSNASKLYLEAQKNVESIQTLSADIIIVSFFFLVLTVLITIVIVTRSISKPLTVLIGEINKIGEGDFHHKIEIKNKDEVGELVIAFNKMIEDLSLLTRELKKEAAKHKKTAKILKQKEKSLASAQRIAHIGHWEWNIETGELEWSDEIYRIFGLKPQEYKVKYDVFMNFVHQDDRKLVSENIDLAIKKDKKYNIDHRIVLAKGNVRYVNEQGEVIYGSNGQPSKMIGTVNDITARKLAEEKLREANQELKELDQLKDSFLRNTTHGLKTPLVPIKAQAEMLLNEDYGELNSKQKEAVEMISRNEERLDLLVNDILDLTIIKSSRLKLRLKETDLEKICSNVVADLNRSAEKKSVTLKLKSASDLPKFFIDKKRIAQVMGDLLGNAIKFTPKKGKIFVELLKKNDEVIVKVTDTGIGISKKNLKKMFKPFFQVDSEVVRKYGGSGLGLSICKGIIKAHGGKIWVKSEGEGKGSTFAFSLPI